MLSLFPQLARRGRHMAFEPIHIHARKGQMRLVPLIKSLNTGTGPKAASIPGVPRSGHEQGGAEEK